MKKTTIKHIEDRTICMLLRVLYLSARLDKRLVDMQIAKVAFIKAKKMNKRLYEYKYNGKLPDIPDNSWKEEDWIKEIENPNMLS